MHLPADLRHWHLKVSLMAHRCTLEWGAGDLDGSSRQNENHIAVAGGDSEGSSIGQNHVLMRLMIQSNASVVMLVAEEIEAVNILLSSNTSIAMFT